MAKRAGFNLEKIGKNSEHTIIYQPDADEHNHYHYIKDIEGCVSDLTCELKTYTSLVIADAVKEKDRELEKWRNWKPDNETLADLKKQWVRSKESKLATTVYVGALEVKIKEKDERIKVLEEALHVWQGLIKYPFSGSKEAMSYLQNADNFTVEALGQ